MMPKQKYKLKIEYDGTDFAGWQVQPGKRTVQGEIEAMLSVLFQENCQLTASGRTDSGVHALGQVAHFTATQPRTEYQIRQGLNSLLADDINIRQVEKAADDFHARFDAVRRHYKYQIIRGNSAIRRRYAWCLPGDLDTNAMQQCADIITGEHDFRSFCSTGAEVSH
ncbi:MAG TPA: tRNA pseudouridine(38-40) synthase TruA, partial [Bacteroidetes bacterium]|nr:tRNA pseudouridine(38-40) synthase TruA [Bacteroidota bacterium]